MLQNLTLCRKTLPSRNGKLTISKLKVFNYFPRDSRKVIRKQDSAKFLKDPYVIV